MDVIITSSLTTLGIIIATRHEHMYLLFNKADLGVIKIHRNVKPITLSIICN